MENRWYGHAGLAQVFALAVKLAQLDKTEEVPCFKQQAQEQLTLAIAQSEQAENSYGKGITLPYKMGNTFPKKQQDRIQALLRS